MSLLMKAHRTGRDIVEVTPRSAGWRYVGFSAHRLAPDESMTVSRPRSELCIVVLGGTVTVSQGDQRWSEIGERGDVFDDRAPYALYLPEGSAVAVQAHTKAEIGIASAPGPGGVGSRLIEPSQMKRFARGSG
jgi:5-deoxy-glucuronate isomerase